MSVSAVDNVVGADNDHRPKSQQVVHLQTPFCCEADFLRLGFDNAGWARQENTVVMPDATQMAGVDMRLEPAGYRELHWHVAAEWSLVLNGSCRIQVRAVPARILAQD